MKIKDSKFYKPPTLKERLTKLKYSIIYSILFWKGRSKGMIHTADISWRDLRAVFFHYSDKDIWIEGFKAGLIYKETNIYNPNI